VQAANRSSKKIPYLAPALSWKTTFFANEFLPLTTRVLAYAITKEGS